MTDDARRMAARLARAIGWKRTRRGGRGGGRARTFALALAAVAIAALGLARSRAEASVTTRVLESDAGRVVLEVIVPEPALSTIDAGGVAMTRAILPGAIPWGEPGKPGALRLPVFVGIPRGARVTASVLQEDARVVRDILLAPAPRDSIASHQGLATPLEIFEPDAASYASAATFPAAKAAVVSTSRMRFQEYVTVELYAVRARAALREIDIVSRTVIEVRWDRGAGSREDDGGAGLDKQQDTPRDLGASWERAPVEDRWEPVYRGLVANPDQAAAFRERIVPRANPLAGPRKSGLRQQDGVEWKLQIEESGLYRISFEALQSRGFPSGTPAGEIRIFQRFVSDSVLWRGENPFSAVEIPLDVLDAGADGFFGAGDAVHVYLRGFREQFMPGDFEDMFAGSAAYWLVVTPGESGARMMSRAGDLGLTGVTRPERFTSTFHLEPDVVFNTDAFGGAHDLWFAAAHDAASADLGVTLTDVDNTRPFRFRVQSVGLTSQPGFDSTHRLSFALNGTPFASFQFDGRARVIYGPDSSFTGSLLREGTNTLTYTGTRGPTEIPGSGAFVDWAEIDYQRLYRASGNRLAFTSGEAAGATEIQVGNFDDTEIFVYDVTAPLAPVRIDAAVIVPAGDGNAIEFQAEVTAGAPQRFEAATAAGARTLTEAQLTADTSGRLAESEADYVMIVYDEFEPTLAPLVAHRESEGLRVKVARLSDVYDEWNGGVASPDAIRRYMKYAFTFWETPPTYALLVGDAKEDHRHRRPSAELDYVPSLPIYNRTDFESGDSWDASDNWYVLLDNFPGGFVRVLVSNNNIGTDNAMDILIGRLSVGSASELGIQVAKTVRYETEDLDGAWRSRYFFIADDSWITQRTSAGRTEYCLAAGQTAFETYSTALARELAGAPLIALDTIFVRHSDVTESLHTVCDDTPEEPRCMTLSNRDMGNLCVIRGVRNTLTPLVFETMNEGVLFTSYQGHGNRWVLSHESIILDGRNHLNELQEDITRFEPSGKPCVFMGYGCSISEFERYLFDDDCLTEKMMSVPNGGAIATFGSSGTEYLTPNLDLNEHVQEAFLAGGFDTPPRFILGQALALGLARYAPSFRLSMLRYVLFGDPALRLRALPPSFTVTSDGNPVDDGDYLIGESGEKPVRIVIRGASPGALDDLRIRRSDTGDIDPLEYPVAGDSAVYLHALEFGTGDPYEIQISAVAVGGGTRTVRLRVDLQADITFDGRTIREGAFVDPSAEIAIAITTPIRVSAEDIEVRFDGELVDAQADSVGPSSWKIVLPQQALSDGAHEIEVSVFSLSSRVSFRVRNDFAILDVLNHPNPFNPHEDAATTFSYRLTRNADEVTIDIYTVNGRKVRAMRNLPGSAGYNPMGSAIDTEWDARDQDGDEVANGVYLYRVRAVSGGATAEAMGKLVILRNEDEALLAP